MMSYTVEGVTWQLSGNIYQVVFPLAASAYGWYYGAKWLFTGEKPKRETMLPEDIIHAGVIVHGYVYEYMKEGVKKSSSSTSGDPGSLCSVDKLLSREKLGQCSISIGDFDRWVAVQKECRFSVERYSVADNHCVHFAIAATDFLGVPHPRKWDNMCGFTERNPNVSKMANSCTRGSGSSSSSS